MFADILGNEYLKEMLVRLRTGGRMPNAMLFAGPDGVGKRLFAIEIARSFVCRSGGDDLVCGVCPACIRAGQFEFPRTEDKDAYKKVIRSNHPDVGTVVAANRLIAVDAIRDLETEAHFRPYEGTARTFIIDDADKMNDASSNALLKTLEEPAPTTHLILITSRPETLLPTIRSRCQIFRFAPVEIEKIEQFLVLKGFDQSSARLAAGVSQGSVGMALTVDAADLRGRRKELLGVIKDAFLSHDRLSLLRASEKLNEAKNKEFYESDLNLILTLVHDAWTLSLGGTEATMTHVDLRPELALIADGAAPAKLAAAMQEIEMIRERLVVNLNKKFSTDDLFMKMAA